MSESEVTVEELGPIDYLVLEWPAGHGTGEGLPLLLDLVDRGLIRIFDLAFVSKGEDGAVTRIPFEQLPVATDFDPSVLDGVSSGILTQEDFDDAAAALEVGSVAGILIYENAWAARFAVAVRKSGGQLVATDRIPVQAIIAALDATEPTD
jgi:hypothetical protein